MMFNLQIKRCSRMLLVLPAICSLAGISAQISDIAGKEKTAYSAFMNGRYELAFHHYNELKDIFRQNPEYHYYLGRCMMEMNKDIIETIDNLKFAAVKGEKPDAWFFLGKAYHLNADYEKAVYAYKRFIKKGKRSAVKQLKVKEALILAENKCGISSARIQDKNEKANENVLEENKLQTGVQEQVSASDEFKNNIINEEVRAEGIDLSLSKAMELQLKADSFNRTAKILRAGLKETEIIEERKKLIAEISHLEKNSDTFRKEADELFETMQKDLAPVNGDDTAKTHEFIELKEEINGIKVYQYKTDIDLHKETSTAQNTDTATNKDKADVNNSTAGNDRFFAGKKVYSRGNPIPPRKVFPDKLVYHIQLGVFSKKIDPESFGAFSPMYFEEIENRGLFKYYAGLFFTYKSAGEAHIVIKSTGYPDSFIVAFYNGRQISVDKARQIEYAQIKF